MSERLWLLVFSEEKFSVVKELSCLRFPSVVSPLCLRSSFASPPLQNYRINGRRAKDHRRMMGGRTWLLFVIIQENRDMIWWYEKIHLPLQMKLAEKIFDTAKDKIEEKLQIIMNTDYV